MNKSPRAIFAVLLAVGLLGTAPSSAVADTTHPSALVEMKLGAGGETISVFHDGGSYEQSRAIGEAGIEIGVPMIVARDGRWWGFLLDSKDAAPLSSRDSARSSSRSLVALVASSPVIASQEDAPVEMLRLAVAGGWLFDRLPGGCLRGSSESLCDAPDISAPMVRVDVWLAPAPDLPVVHGRLGVAPFSLSSPIRDDYGRAEVGLAIESRPTARAGHLIGSLGIFAASAHGRQAAAEDGFDTPLEGATTSMERVLVQVGLGVEL
jgi:hypothetical protein